MSLNLIHVTTMPQFSLSSGIPEQPVNSDLCLQLLEATHHFTATRMVLLKHKFDLQLH